MAPEDFIDIRTLSEQVKALAQDVQDINAACEVFKALLAEQRHALQRQSEELVRLNLLLRKLATHLSLPRLD